MLRRVALHAGYALRPTAVAGQIAAPSLPRNFASPAIAYSFQKYAVGLRYVLGVGAVAIASASTSADDLRMAYLIPSRLARDVYTAARLVADYKMSLNDKKGDERKEALEGCHQRGAQQLLDLCFANGGIYIKLGQHIGQLDHLLPRQYVETMRDNLLDRCPASSYAEVREILQQDLGSPPEQLFASFEETPIASASLAQVHVATAHDGRKLAVKVQHAGLRETSAADIATIELLVKAVRYIFPDFDYQWLVDEVKCNLPLELDFKHEAVNADACRVNLVSSRSRLGGRVHVPEVYPHLSSHRVLAMEFIGDAVGVSDIDGIRKMGFRPGDLAKLISETFNEMIFIHGHVHCDPHAANMLVRKDKDGRMQLVLLDHGLYKELDSSFRLAYAGLWRSLILADEAGIRKHSEQMNAGGDAVRLFTMMLTQRPWEQVVKADMGHLHIPRTNRHREHVQEQVAKHAKQISQMLLNMPRPLLLLLKTNDCLRAVDYALGQPINTFVITARECTRALAEHRMEVAAGQQVTTSTSIGVSPNGHMQQQQQQQQAVASGVASSARVLVRQARMLPARLRNAWEACSIEARIFLLHALTWSSSWRDRFAWLTAATTSMTDE